MTKEKYYHTKRQIKMRERTRHLLQQPSAEVLKSRALIQAAREALRPENWALRPVS